LIRIAIADDHGLVRLGIRSLLEEEEDMSIVGEAEDGEAIIRLVLENPIDVVLMDVEMPKLDGMEATRRVKAHAPQVKVLVLTIHDEPQLVDGLLGVGANGYVLKNTYTDHLVDAVRVVNAGGLVLGADVAGGMVRRLRGQAADGVGYLASIPERESEVLDLIVRGLTNREIASRMGLSERTVKGYVGGLLRRFEVSNRTALVARAVDAGLIEG
jgi:DNA-binding NarL/FixJ family response regulator